jgi:hypothetical protein
MDLSEITIHLRLVIGVGYTELDLHNDSRRTVQSKGKLYFN